MKQIKTMTPKGYIEKNYGEHHLRVMLRIEDVVAITEDYALAQRQACAEAAKEFIHQHISLQELRDLYLEKIMNAEIDKKYLEL